MDSGRQGLRTTWKWDGLFGPIYKNNVLDSPHLDTHQLLARCLLVGTNCSRGMLCSSTASSTPSFRLRPHILISQRARIRFGPGPVPRQPACAHFIISKPAFPPWILHRRCPLISLLSSRQEPFWLFLSSPCSVLRYRSTDIV